MHLRAVSTPLSILGYKLYMHTYRTQQDSKDIPIKYNKLVHRGLMWPLFLIGHLCSNGSSCERTPKTCRKDVFVVVRLD
jgi:hypothetical protein